MPTLKEILESLKVRAAIEQNVAAAHDQLDPESQFLSCPTGQYPRAEVVGALEDTPGLYDKVTDLIRNKLKIPLSALKYYDSGEEAIVFGIEGLEEKTADGESKPTFLLKLSPSQGTINAERSYFLNKPVHTEIMDSVRVAIVPYVKQKYRSIWDVRKTEMLESGLWRHGLEVTDFKYSNFRYEDDERYPVITDLRAIGEESPGQRKPGLDPLEKIYESIHKKLNRGVGYGIDAVHRLADAVRAFQESGEIQPHRLLGSGIAES